ncbi:Efflux pump FUS6 [Colletotrichum fructicola]|nr:Efflux pump FUS6 [Colletotrichum fructicola]KAF4417600.1 Efflux pump FUS6 [Colletotrichum fructicola]KAF4881018.1 Efflux pump FUS6 [Colletotrichum fructicola]
MAALAEIQYDVPPQWTMSARKIAIFVSLSVMSLVIALDANIIVTSLLAIIQDIGGTSTQAFWVGTAYLISCAVVMPFIESVSNIFGRREVLIPCIGLFTAGTLMCCFTPGIALMIAGRVVQGVGAGGMYVLCLVIFTDIVPLRLRFKLYGIIQGAWAIGSISGPIIGGAVAEHTTWRWVFYLNLPICAYCLAFFSLFCQLKKPVETVARGVAHIDWLGGFLFTASWVSLLIGMSWGGVQFAWGSAQTVAPITLGVVGLAVTVIYEARYASHPFLKKTIFTSVNSVLVYILGFLQGLILYGQLYYVPFYFLSVQSYTPTTSGVAMLPVSVLLVPGFIVSGVLITRLNSYRWAIWVGWTLTMVTSGLLIQWDVGTSVVVWVVTLMVGGVGHGFVLNAQTFVSGVSTPEENAGESAAMYLFCRTLGTAIGVNVGSSVFQNFMAMRLPVELSAVAHHAEQYLATLRSLPSGAYKDSVLGAYAFAFQRVHTVFTGVAGLGLLLSVCIPRHSLDRTLPCRRTSIDTDDVETTNAKT